MPAIARAENTAASQTGNPRVCAASGCRGIGAGAWKAGADSIGGARGLISGGGSAGAAGAATGSRMARVEGGGVAAAGCDFLVQSGHSV